MNKLDNELELNIDTELEKSSTQSEDVSEQTGGKVPPLQNNITETQSVGAALSRPQQGAETEPQQSTAPHIGAAAPGCHQIGNDPETPINPDPKIQTQALTDPQKEKGKTKATLKKLLKFCKPWYGALIVSFIFAIGTVVLQLVAPTFVQNMVDYLIGGLTYTASGGLAGLEYANFYDSIVRIGILVAILYAASFLLGYIQQFLMAGITAKVQKKFRRRLSQKVNKMPLSVLDQTPTGDTLSRITNDVETVTESLNYAAPSLVMAAAMILGSTVAMFIGNWIMALTAIGSSLLAFAVIAFITGKTQKYFVRQQKEVGEVNAHVEEYFSGHTALKTNNARGVVGAEFNRLNNKLYNSNWKAQFYGGLMMPLMFFLSMFSQLAVSIVGGVLAFNGTISFGVVISFMIYVNLFTQPLTDIAMAAMQMQGAIAASSRVFELLHADEMQEEEHLNKISRDVKGDIVFENVKFGYEKDKVIIKNFSADIKAGSKVAIVGPTGAGKTTLVNLLMKFYNIDDGDIKIDGKSIKEIRRGNVANKFSMVLQDAWIYHGTIRQNLLYNLDIDKATEQQLLDTAAKATGIEHFIKTLPNGYDTMLDDKATISDGQKQLLTIARAMIKDAPLLILDEATSSVDTRTEIIVKEAMDKLTAGRTSFVIAHRLSTIKNADVILVLKDGDVVETGNHGSLLKAKGFYSELYNSQFAA